MKVGSNGKSQKMYPETYLDLIKDGKMDEARRYKSSFIPKTLYKYYFLFDERYSNHEQENKIRLETLENNQLWLSTADNLNDPFEFKAMFLDEQTIKERGWNVDQVKFVSNYLRRSFGVACFSNNFNSNMPMWAHYSNNHQGFCVEYTLDD